ncbi:P-loop containing nucleoside triphosphate hydrolase protein [Aspergillus insuetus]
MNSCDCPISNTPGAPFYLPLSGQSNAATMPPDQMDARAAMNYSQTGILVQPLRRIPPGPIGYNPQIPGGIGSGYGSDGQAGGLSSASHSRANSNSGSVQPLLHSVPPFHLHNFYGREDVIKAIAAHFEEYKFSTPVFCLYGKDGVGKNQCAIHYINDHHTYFDAGFWISADQGHKIMSEYFAIAGHLGNNQSSLTIEQCTGWFKDWLQRNGSWLIVFDNVDDPKLLTQHWPFRLDAEADGLILTSRKQLPGLGSLATSQKEVKCFSANIGARFFWDLLPDPDESERELATTIVHRLGGLPLAINHIASYLHQNPMPLHDFLHLLGEAETEQMIIEEHDASDTVIAYERTLASAWTLSIEAVQTSPDSQRRTQTSLQFSILIRSR